VFWRQHCATYSGHGIASAGENYLIPTDVEEPSTVLLSVQGVKQSEVLGILRGEAPNAAYYLVLDACRHTLQGTRGGAQLPRNPRDYCAATGRDGPGRLWVTAVEHTRILGYLLVGLLDLRDRKQPEGAVRYKRRGGLRSLDHCSNRLRAEWLATPCLAN
jgi:hypothetical protein